MHRTYSMRQSRAPTASQIQNPPPPTSSTKSGRFFGKASVGEWKLSASAEASLENIYVLLASRAIVPPTE